MMSSWTREHSLILSKLLDGVVGTEKVVALRQDFCRIVDCLASKLQQTNNYFTGSKAEGLDLPGSDKDFMTDQNDLFQIQVIQSLTETSVESPYNIFLMSTENVFPGFALLQHVNQTLNNKVLRIASPNRYGTRYLSSDLLVEAYKTILSQVEPDKIMTRTRQGPSLDTWSEYCDKSAAGSDDVLSIHCAFWPAIASEWTQRPRYFNWPTSHDISSIIDFGCHLVPVGHPNSDTKLLEWRISFSVAERTLVWSFNHIQIQCYAVMKLILKEFIKVRCSPVNQILCSYFIKTFLFWKFETNDLNIWRADNLRECIMYLLTDFSQCLRDGVLRHYFIPSFNLLSVKLTRAAKTELLQLFDIIIQSDISVLRECRTLQYIWSDFLKANENKNKVLLDLKKRNMFKNDECIMSFIDVCRRLICSVSRLYSQYRLISALLTVSCKTHLKNFVLKCCLIQIHFTLLIQHDQGNKEAYQLHRIAQRNIFSTDISSSKLWYAIFLLRKRDYSSVLRITNEILSSIPPFVLNENINKSHWNNEAKQLYVDMFLDSDTSVMQRARKSWMFELSLRKNMTEMTPLAIQIELYFSDRFAFISLSPFTCTYYLQFLCYHQMCQYDSRNCALQQLIDVLNYSDYCGIQFYNTLNIAGHCLLLSGQRARAWEMFNESYQHTQRNPPLHKYNSALWYLQNYCWTTICETLESAKN